jgi:thiamine biosynthesis lipoprotein
VPSARQAHLFNEIIFNHVNTEQKDEWHHVFHSMGIPIHLTLLGVGKKVGEMVAQKVEKIFHNWDARASRFREDSELMKIITNAGGWVKVSPELFAILHKGKRLSEKTHGLFDMSVGAYLAAAHYGLPHDYVLPGTVPTYETIELNEQTHEVRVAKNQVIEPAALVKGKAIDDAGFVLTNEVPAWMINAGGDILTRGLYHQSPWRVGIQDPRDTKKILEIVSVSNAAIATSGTYVVNKRINGKKWHHEINPKTGKPTASLLSLSVIANSAAQADIISTIAFLHDQEAEAYLQARTEPYLIVTSNLQIISGNGWQAYTAS